MEPSSSSGESISSIETYATAANHPMPAILTARRVILLCGLFGVRRSHDRSLQKRTGPLFGLIFRCIYIYSFSDGYIYIKPNSVRIRSLSCQMFVLPSTEFELTPLIHCSTNSLALCPAPQTTRSHLLYIYGGPVVGIVWQLGLYNYITNQCLSPLAFRVRNPFRRRVLDITLCDKVCQ